MTWETFMHAVQVYVVVVVHVGLVAAVAYPVIYHRAARWRASRVGRALMLKATSLAALFVVSVLGYWWPFPGFRLIYAAVVTAVTVALWHQVVVLVQVFRERDDA